MKRNAWLSDARALVFDNWPYKLVTLCFAVLTWALVQNEQVVEERAKVRLEWTLPDGLVTVEPMLETATVTVSGVQALMRNLRPGDLTLQIDLSRAQEGDVTVDLSDRPIRGLSEELRVVGITPGTLRVQLDGVVKKRVRVGPTIKGEPADGFAVREVLVVPERVELTGPASRIRAMAEVMTDDVDVTGLREDAEFELGLDLPRGGAVRMTRPGPVTVTVRVASTLRQRTFERVPVVVRGERYVAGLNAMTVTLEGPEKAIAAIRADALSVMVFAADAFTEPAGEATLGGPDAMLRFEVLGVESPVKVLSLSADTIPVSLRPPL